jgi:hypothetical protein
MAKDGDSPQDRVDKSLISTNTPSPLWLACAKLFLDSLFCLISQVRNVEKKQHQGDICQQSVIKQTAELSGSFLPDPFHSHSPNDHPSRHRL